jgi:hypothetical protein
VASNKKKDKAISVFAIIAIVLCVCALCLGFLKSQSEDLYYNLENSKKVEISRVEDITSLGEEIYNNECVLTKDIYITDGSIRIGTTERPFAGTFDGKGHTVYLEFNTANQDTSLFGCIDTFGVVKNTRFVFSSITVDGNTYGGIAKINYGTIQDCKIECANIKINNNIGIYSPCVITNKGTIVNMVVDCTFSNSKIYDNEASILFGGVCTYNYSTVKNCIVAPTFSNIACSDEFKILTGETTNVGVCAICAVNTSGASTTNSVAILQAGVYTSDKNSGLKIVDIYSSITNEETIFYELDFNNSVWKIKNNKLVLVEG